MANTHTSLSTLTLYRLAYFNHSDILSRVPCPNLAFGRDNPIFGRSTLYPLIGLNDRICLATIACRPVSLCYVFHVTSCELVINMKQVQLRYCSLVSASFLHGTCASSCVLHRRKWVWRMCVSYARALCALRPLSREFCEKSKVTKDFWGTESAITPGAVESSFQIKKNVQSH